MSNLNWGGKVGVGEVGRSERYSRHLSKSLCKIKKIKSLLTNCTNFCADLEKNIIIIDNYLRPRDSWAQPPPPMPVKIFDFPLNFTLGPLIFHKGAWSTIKTKANKSVLRL